MTDEKNFWLALPTPLPCLAPMSNITDSAMRLILARHCKPDVIFTEFISTAGLTSPKGRSKLLPDLRFDPGEHPLVAQFFGRVPSQFFACASLAADLGYDGVDINLGCPDRSVLRQGAGSSLIREPALVAEIIQAAREGARGLPVSVKTRIGYSQNTVETWIGQLIGMKPAAITLHGRTRKQKYLGSADWSAIAHAASMAREAGIPLIGNGDVASWQDAMDRAREAGVDGVMIGRAAIGNPWVFSPETTRKKIPLEDLLSVIIEHAGLYQEHYDGIKSFANVRKHLKNYVADFHGAKSLRIALVHAENADHVREIVHDFLHNPPASDSQQE